VQAWDPLWAYQGVSIYQLIEFVQIVLFNRRGRRDSNPRPQPWQGWGQNVCCGRRVGNSRAARRCAFASMQRTSACFPPKNSHFLPVLVISRRETLVRRRKRAALSTSGYSTKAQGAKRLDGFSLRSDQGKRKTPFPPLRLSKFHKRSRPARVDSCR
jgi:hypothetical protein